MIVFLDTEFTGLNQRRPRLISIGLVSECGREFYAEMPMESYYKNCATWTTENVLPLLECGDRIMQPDMLHQRIRQWFLDMGAVQIATDAPAFDFTFLREVLYPWSENVDKKPIWFDMSNGLLDQAYQSYFTEDKPQHHALNDALALRHAWLATRD